MRVILTETEDEADQALAALGRSDDSPETLEEVAKKYSIDEATKSTGGLRQGVVAGQSEPALDEADLLRGRGRARRPVRDRRRLLRDPGREDHPGDDPVARRDVERAGPRRRSPPSASRRSRTQFQDDFQTKWIARTFCAEDYRIDRCSNAPSPAARPVHRGARSTPPAATRSVPVARGRSNPGRAGVFGSPPPVGPPAGPASGPRPRQPAPCRPAWSRAEPCRRAVSRRARCRRAASRRAPSRRAPCRLARRLRAASGPMTAGAPGAWRRSVGLRGARAPRRDHPQAAAGVPLGSRAGRALDRPAHGRGGLRARRRRRGAATTRSSATSSATCSSRSSSSRCCSRSASAGSLAEVAETSCREADPPPSARLRRRSEAETG